MERDIRTDPITLERLLRDSCLATDEAIHAVGELASNHVFLARAWMQRATIKFNGLVAMMDGIIEAAREKESKIEDTDPYNFGGTGRGGEDG